MSDVHMHPFEVLGWEGIIGTIFMLAILAVATVVPGDVQSCLPTDWAQLMYIGPTRSAGERHVPPRPVLLSVITIAIAAAFSWSFCCRF